MECKSIKQRIYTANGGKMRLLKFFVVMILLILAAISATWYYVTTEIANNINKEYAGKTFPIHIGDNQDYLVSFDRVVPSGFPFNISWKLKGWKEESRSANNVYNESIKFGYNLLTQKIFIDYDGEVISKYKPENLGFGSKIRLNNYNIRINLPMTMSLINTIRRMKDSSEIINYIGDTNISTDKVEMFDLIEGEKFYEKKYENLKLTFVPAKKYTDLVDLLNNIPKNYTIDYALKLEELNVEERKLPISLFYIFSSIPHGIDINAKAQISTAGKTFEEIRKNLEIKADINFDSKFVSVKNFEIDYKLGADGTEKDYNLDIKTKTFLKNGLFDEIFKNYTMLSAELKSVPPVQLIDDEIQYIIKHSEDFKFRELENKDYDFNIKVKSSHNKHKAFFDIDDLSIFSTESGIKIKHSMETMLSRDKQWLANGVIFVKDYPAVIEFTSPYIYRFGKFRILSKEAKELYIDVNKEFLKSISDHPYSTSNDLSIEYSIDSTKINYAKIGNSTSDIFHELYTFILYKNLLKQVGSEGDVLEKMRKIIPDIDANEPILKRLLPKTLKKEVDKVIPSKTKDNIDKILPKKEVDGNKLLNNLSK